MGEGAHDTVAGEEVPGLFDGFLTAILEISPFQSIDAPFFLIEILPVNPLEKQEKVHCLLLFPVLHVQPVFPVQERELAVPKCDIPKRRAARAAPVCSRISSFSSSLRLEVRIFFRVGPPSRVTM